MTALHHDSSPEGWIGEVKAAGVAAAARILGLELRDRPAPGNLKPCPACGAEQRGTGDRRGPIGITRDGLGWTCHRCKEGGDAVTLAAWAVAGCAAPAGRWGDIRERLLGAASSARLPRRPLPPPPPLPRPPAAEVRALWAACARVDLDQELAADLERRAIDPALAADRDLCRALPPGLPLPPWARFGGRSWAETGHRAIFAMYGASGVLESLHARSLAADAPRPKGLSPAGCSVVGLVFADPLGRLLLAAGAAPPWWEPFEGGGRLLLIAEGPPDFLTLATRYADTEAAPAVLGVIAGSWGEGLARRLPRGLDIVVATHLDEAGDGYARRILETLPAAAPRRITRGRWRAHV